MTFPHEPAAPRNNSRSGAAPRFCGAMGCGASASRPQWAAALEATMEARHQDVLRAVRGLPPLEDVPESLEVVPSRKRNESFPAMEAGMTHESGTYDAFVSHAKKLPESEDRGV